MSRSEHTSQILMTTSYYTQRHRLLQGRDTCNLSQFLVTVMNDAQHYDDGPSNLFSSMRTQPTGLMPVLDLGMGQVDIWDPGYTKVMTASVCGVFVPLLLRPYDE